MKQQTQYEVSDIDLKNESHKFIYTQLIVSNLIFAMVAPTLKNNVEKAEAEMLRATATFLSAMADAGFELVKKEQSIPSIFREGTPFEKD